MKKLLFLLAVVGISLNIVASSSREMQMSSSRLALEGLDDNDEE